MKRKLFSLLLILCMMLTLFPTGVFAAGPGSSFHKKACLPCIVEPRESTKPCFKCLTQVSNRLIAYDLPFLPLKHKGRVLSADSGWGLMFKVYGVDDIN